MSKKGRTAIQPTREQNYPEWYQEVIKQAELAEHAPVRGCMVIKPGGYALWENIQRILDARFKEMGHKNIYLPLLIPLSYLEREAEHVEGFAKECAIVTHHRLVQGKEGKLIPASPLEEPLVIRPTSEMLIGEMFSKWIDSYRDLPLLTNQWANVMRWEMRTRLFLRTTEFLWQEGHTAHATADEALEETLRMLETYADFVENILAIPLIKGEKTASERFPGADRTFTLEAMMQDGKALQVGTTHFLGQNFSKANKITFRDPAGETQYAWTTSWGVTTRLIGGLIMVHGDDDGLVIPPKIAETHVVIIPLIHKEIDEKKLLEYCTALEQKMKAVDYNGRPLSVLVDKREMRTGDKVWSWIKKGVPIRIEVGQRELEFGQLSIAKRHKGHKDFEKQTEDELITTLPQQLDAIQEALFVKAKTFRDEHLVHIDTKEEFYQFFKKGKGLAVTQWSEDPQMEKTLQQELSVTPRCIPMDFPEDEGECPFTGKKSCRRVIFGKSY